MLRIAHLVNPVSVGAHSDLCLAQPLVYKSMQIARDFAADVVAVDLVAVIFDEDRDAVPDQFMIAAPLTRSILNFGTFEQPRKLPLLADIINLGMSAAEDADFYIYSNVDIILMPHTYRWIAGQLEAGVDALVINRRTIREDVVAGGLDEIWSAIGVPHDGYDFFVFSRAIAAQLQLDRVVIGVPQIGWTLNANLAVLGRRHVLIEDGLMLTKHIGDDRAWTRDERREFITHNAESANRAFAALGVTPEQMNIHRASYRSLQRRPRWRRQLDHLMRLLRTMVRRRRSQGSGI